MPRERRVQAETDWTQRPGARAGSGPMSVWLVAGVVFLAVSLVAVGAIVAFSALGGGSRSSGQGNATPPSQTPPTPVVIVVSKQDGSGSSPAAGPTPGTNTSVPPL